MSHPGLSAEGPPGVPPASGSSKPETGRGETLRRGRGRPSDLNRLGLNPAHAAPTTPTPIATLARPLSGPWVPARPTSRTPAPSVPRGGGEPLGSGPVRLRPPPARLSPSDPRPGPPARTLPHPAPSPARVRPLGAGQGRAGPVPPSPAGAGRAASPPCFRPRARGGAAHAAAAGREAVRRAGPGRGPRWGRGAGRRRTEEPRAPARAPPPPPGPRGSRRRGRRAGGRRAGEPPPPPPPPPPLPTVRRRPSRSRRRPGPGTAGASRATRATTRTTMATAAAGSARGSCGGRG